MPLPSNSTEASRLRYSLAAELAQRCPASMACEVALTGSASRGVADEYSDIELNFWSEKVPDDEVRAAWYSSAGAKEVSVREENAGGTTWDGLVYGGVWVQAGWQEVKTLKAELSAILEAETTDHERLMIADVIARAVPLRSNGLLPTWTARLENYPNSLREKLFVDAVFWWTRPLHVSMRWALVRRGQHLALANYLQWEVRAILRLLCAINRRWEPDWKWLRELAVELPEKPEKLVERIDATVNARSARERVTLSTRLALDTLSLLPGRADAELAASVLMESLRGAQGG